MENQSALMNEIPTDGCIVLGRKGPAYTVYNTRFHVNRKERRTHLFRDFLLDNCAPCCKAENQSAPCRAIWSVLRSESFLFVLHVFVLSIGVSKHLYADEVGKLVHLYQSVMELLLTTVHMCVRMSNVWGSFSDLKVTVKDVEYVDQDVSIRGKAFRRFVVCYITMGGVLIVANFIFFIVFQHAFNLNWTVLTNNLFILIVNSVSRSLMERIISLRGGIREDACRVTLCEMSLLLRESFMLKESEARSDYLARVERFMTAYSNTPYFYLPKHIQVLREYVPDWNVYSSAEHVTVV